MIEKNTLVVSEFDDGEEVAEGAKSQLKSDHTYYTEGDGYKAIKQQVLDAERTRLLTEIRESLKEALE